MQQSILPPKVRLVVHTYKTIPSHSFIALDVEESGGFIIADIGPYLGRNHARPSLMLVKKKGGLYEHYRELNRLLWAESAPYRPEAIPTAGVKTRTQVFVSGEGHRIL